MIFVDTHAHLADPAFAFDVDSVIARAREAGAAAVICIGESPGAADRSSALAERHRGFLYRTAGVHPHDAHQFNVASDVPALRAHLMAGAVAVGECGLDYHYDHSPRREQLEAFAAQIELARDTAKPVVVHTREAEEDTHEMVTDAGRRGVRGVMHCFTGSAGLARAALDAGWFISFSGIITFRKWVDDDLLRLVPEDRLLAESDAPYLAPVPHRGKRNEPAWVPLTIARLAAARAADADTLSARLTDNARALFGLATIG